MSYLIADGSPKKAAAEQFSAELRRALEARQLSMKSLNRALGGTSQTKLWHYSSARLLPRLSTAIEIAEALEWPRLAEIVRAARSQPYCSGDCRSAALKLRAHLGQAENAEDDPERRLVARLKVELDRVRGRSQARLSRIEVRHAIREYERTAPQARRRRLQGQVDQHMTAVEAFCNGCEPEGICRDAECPLRPVSPLPVREMRNVELATRPPGRWGRPGAREAFSESLRERHAAKPEWREGTRQRSHDMWAALTPEERRQRIRAMVDGRLASRAKQYEQCGCPRSRGHKQGCQFRRGRRSEVPA